ncbi:uncharacterized protein LOC9317002 isoform X2 [Arabidopsis lyrata subsp. lyrata]|uniref:uncharacterized protein LOC9317002 isoform X2 n=1 Tax=Arabidopsis lyrata subsp. lyrata TaxID=81972 RepID=UPI000A29B266|nr:uncharacterized protein LOC9317002 isoform X2 [Arabidopsis lyrata subsp. lyrata]|eukprot:XP_020884575.1 uncharacterized protein LOC9317002 isoform X2 [Arabidopsis lyrata subsp. lyrata]
MRLRSLIRRMTGRDDDVSFTELQELTSHLENVQRIVEDHMKKNKAEDVATSIPVPSTSSSEQREDKELLKMEREFERRKSESLQSEFERLRIYNERMNGRGIESMSCYHDVVQLDSQITYALMSLSEQMTRPLEEQLCKAELGKHVVKIYGKPITDENKELRRSVRLAKKKE